MNHVFDDEHGCRFVGGIVADCYIGQFRTILYLTLIYIVGDLVITLTSVVPLGAPNLTGVLVALFMIGKAIAPPQISQFDFF